VQSRGTRVEVLQLKVFRLPEPLEIERKPTKKKKAKGGLPFIRGLKSYQYFHMEKGGRRGSASRVRQRREDYRLRGADVDKERERGEVSRHVDEETKGTRKSN